MMSSSMPSSSSSSPLAHLFYGSDAYCDGLPQGGAWWRDIPVRRGAASKVVEGDGGEGGFGRKESDGNPVVLLPKDGVL